ncbi:MAG: multicopper oxidase domain-containing protein [Nitrospira sp.]|nr:multicopper oxidase domain-containing protein [Nitrospira sp.]
MAKDVSDGFAKNVMGSHWATGLAGVLGLMLCVSGNELAQATTGIGPYVVPQVKDADNNPNNGVETWIVAEETTVDIGGGVKADAMTFKSCSDPQLKDCTKPGIPGPEFRLKVNDRVIVHFVNNLKKSGLTPEANVSGIHWHGIELNNASDGTELTQPAVDPTGGSFTYDFTVTRPGIFWYHPHHHSSTNQVAKGLYGSIIIEDPYEDQLRGSNPLVDGVIPSVAHTKTLVLSDITVCGKPGTNPATFDSNLPHVSGIQSWQINYQNHILTQSPRILCDTYPLDANGVYLKQQYRKGDVPNIQSPSLTGSMSEGFTVLTNGVNVGGRAGNPHVPGPLGPLASGSSTLDVQGGQGLRLQIINSSPVRYMRLRLTDSNAVQIPLVRIGGQGGLLDNAVVEGGSPGGLDTKYESGEILLPPAGRADVVAAIPRGASGVLTLWTEDFQRVAATWSWTPTVPVMHLKVTDSPVANSYVIPQGLRANFGNQARVPVLNSVTGDLFTASEIEAAGENGSPNKDIQLTFFTNLGAFEASIDGVPMPRDFDGGMASGNPFYLESARHAIISNVIELKVTNTTGAHHPFHLHGFSFQPKSLTLTGGPSYNFPYNEFLDILDVPASSTLTFLVSLDGRPMKGELSGLNGGLGRWLFHCHILPHATFGMMSELHVH